MWDNVHVPSDHLSLHVSLYSQTSMARTSLGPCKIVLDMGSSSTWRLTFTTLWVNSADDKLVIFFLIFSQKKGFDISCKLSSVETICMKCQILFSGKIRKIFQNAVC